MPLWMTLSFLSLVSALCYALHSYTLWRLSVDLTQPTLNTLSVKLPLVALTVCYFTIGRWLTPRHPWVRALAWCAAVWLGLHLYLMLWGALAQLVALTGLSSTQRAHWWIFGALLCSAWGLWQGTRPPLVRRLSISIKGLPPPLEGLKIVQLSDIHIGPTLGALFARRLVEVSRACSPDLIVITGDLVDGTVERLKDDVEPIFELEAPLGVYFVTGNHELISEAGPWVEYLRSRGVTVLENQGLQLTHRGETLNLIGVEDWEGGRFPPPRPPSLAQALEGRAPSAPTILLAHQPKAAHEASAHGVDLQLSGHTHGGQLFPLSWLIYLDQPYRSGLYQLGDMSLYVSEGTGYWGPPMRLGTRAEVTALTLTRAQASEGALGS